MKHQTLKWTMSVIAILAAGALGQAWASGGGKQLVANFSTGAQLGIIGNPDVGDGSGVVFTQFWIQGRASQFNSGKVPTVSQIKPLGIHEYFIWSDWGAPGVNGTCPPVSERTVFLYSIENKGAGQYLLLSTAFSRSPGGWNFDSITNGNSAKGPQYEEPVAIPALNVAYAVADGDGMIVRVTWNPIENLKGFYDSCFSSNLITGVAVRYRVASGTYISYRASDWPLATSGYVPFGSDGFDPGQAQVRIPNPTEGTVYLALSVLFEGAQPNSQGFRTETEFVGAAAPAPDPASSSVTFGPLASLRSGRVMTTGWTMLDEGDIVSYTVKVSSAAGGPFADLSSPIPRDDAAGRAYTFTNTWKSTMNFVRVDGTTSSGLVLSSPVVPVVNSHP